LIVTYFARGLKDTSTVNAAEVTWEQLVESLGTHARRPDKEGPGFAPTEFSKEPCRCGMHVCPKARGHRLNQNVLRVHALALDLDKSGDGGPMTYDAANEVLAQLVSRGVAFCVYSTHSYSPPEKAAMRALVRLSRPVELAEWDQFWHAAIAWLGIPVGTGSKAGKADAPSRFWYLPSAPEGAEVLAGSFPGAPLDVDALLAGAPAVEAKKAPAATVEVEFAEPTVATAQGAWEALQKHGPHIQDKSPGTHTFQACAIVRNDWKLPDEIAWPLIVEWNKSSQPPYSEEKLRDVFDRCAERYASGEPGKARAEHEFAKEFEKIIPKSEGPATVPQIRVELVRIADLAKEIIRESKLPRLKTPFPKLENAVGGFRAGVMTSLVAPPGFGKTSFSLQLAKFCARSGPVIHWSGELTQAQLAARIISQELKVPWSDVLDGKIELSRMKNVLEPLQLHFIRGPDPVAAISSALEQVDRAGQVPLVIVDYLQKGVVANSDIRTSVMQLSRALNALAEQHELIMFCLAQPNRSSARSLRTGKGTAAEAVDAGGESGAIEQDSGNQLSLSLEMIDGQDTHVGRLIVGKARFRGPGVLGVRFHGAEGYFEFLEEVPDTTEESELKQAIVTQVAMHQNKQCTCSSWEPLSGNDLTKGVHSLGKTRPHVQRAIRELKAIGRLQEKERGYVLGRRDEVS
jgi:replicative DNA helicase/biotin operon repressor